MYIVISLLNPATKPISLNYDAEVSSKNPTTPYICGFFAAAVVVISVRRFISARLQDRHRLDNEDSDEKKRIKTLEDMGPTLFQKQPQLERVDAVALRDPSYFPPPEATSKADAAPREFVRQYTSFERTNFYDYEAEIEGTSGKTPAGGKAIHEKVHVFDLLARLQQDEGATDTAVPAVFSRRTVRVFGTAR